MASSKLSLNSFNVASISVVGASVGVYTHCPLTAVAPPKHVTQLYLLPEQVLHEQSHLTHHPNTLSLIEPEGQVRAQDPSS